MKNKVLALAILLFSAANLNCIEDPVENDVHKLWTDCNLASVVSYDIFSMAVHGYRKILNIRNKNIITIIDYSKPSTENRFFVINIEKKLLLFSCLVAHGKNSGENYASLFSNLSNSLQSCIGFFLTAESYNGQNGYSMKLDGLEATINNNAREREIVIHGADYVSMEYILKYGRLGRSWGCPALPLQISREIIDAISGGSCLFIYGVNKYYEENSNFAD